MSKIKHTSEEKILITKAVLSGESSQAELARQYNTSEGRIREWVVTYKANGISAFLPQRRNNVYREMYSYSIIFDLNGFLPHQPGDRKQCAPDASCSIQTVARRGKITYCHKP